jgi:hypothetical protein
MPRIDDTLLHITFYLYPTKSAAEKGERLGGTGFFFGVASAVASLGHHYYAVSNQHVVCNNPVIRINTVKGEQRILDLDPADWHPHPDGDDVAITPFRADDDMVVSFFNESLCVTPEQSAARNVGVGDDVFMIGRFMPHDGQLENKPSVRFGNISVMPDPMRKIYQSERRFYQESYCVDMRSISGYSGSPVFIYRARSFMTPPSLYFHFLGIHWGSITDLETQEHAGINGVVPAWKLMELVMTEKFKKQREEDVAAHLGRTVAPP